MDKLLSKEVQVEPPADPVTTVKKGKRPASAAALKRSSAGEVAPGEASPAEKSAARKSVARKRVATKPRDEVSAPPSVQEILKPRPGRPRTLKTTSLAQFTDAVVRALLAAGGADYLLMVAREDPKTFCALLTRILPLKPEGAAKPDSGIALRWSGMAAGQGIAVSAPDNLPPLAIPPVLLTDENPAPDGEADSE